MTERKILKKELSKYRKYLSDLPMLIDCSEVYGDNYYTQADVERTQKHIKELEEKIEKLNQVKLNNTII